MLKTILTKKQNSNSQTTAGLRKRRGSCCFIFRILNIALNERSDCMDKKTINSIFIDCNNKKRVKWCNTAGQKLVI